MDKRLPRVLVLGNLPPHVLGGAENQIARLVEAWLAAGAHVEVAGHRIPNGDQAVGVKRVRTHRLNPWKWAGRAGRGLGYMLSLWWLSWCRRRQFDVAYCRGLGDAALALALGRRLGLVRWPLVVVPINARGAGDAHFLRSLPSWRMWCRVLDQQIDAFNLINSNIGADLDALGLRHAPRFSIPNGIPLAPNIERAHPADERRLVWTGRLESQKGLDLLLPALAACHRVGMRFRLALWGDGSQRDALRLQALALGLSEIVTFHGACMAHKVRDVLRDADAFVLPSRYEGMSNAALEAMEAGLPVLCTRCGGIDAALDDGAGWVCAPGDAVALEATLRIMFAESGDKWIARGQRARSLIESRFAIGPVAEANLELLERVARGDALS